MFSESEIEAEPEADTKAPSRARSSVVESFNSEPEGGLKLDLILLLQEPLQPKRELGLRHLKSLDLLLTFPIEAGKKKSKSSSKWFKLDFSLFNSSI